MTSKSSRGHLLSALAELTTLDRAALAQRWTAAFGVPAPKSYQLPPCCARRWRGTCPRDESRAIETWV